MKTNATSESVIKAVKTVSKNLYGGNVIFRKEPHNITKNVISFTLRTKDAEKPGSIVTANGQKHPKANWDVHMNVIKELFKLENKGSIYVDTIAGRLYSDNIPEDKATVVEEMPQKPEKEKLTPEKRLMKAILYIAKHRDQVESLFEKAL
jgi:hypothetical protein